MKTTKHEFEIRRRVAAKYIDRLEEMSVTPARVEMYREEMMDQLVMSLTHNVVEAGTERISLCEYFQVTPYPVDWWQAVKDRFAPSWFKRRWPVKRSSERASVRHEIDLTVLLGGVKIPQGMSKLVLWECHDTDVTGASVSEHEPLHRGG